MSPEYRDTTAAWRLKPGTEKRLEVRLPLLLVPPVPLALGALVSGNLGAAAVLLGGAALSLGGAFGPVERPITPRPMTESHAEIVKLLQASASKLERHHAFLGWLADTERRVPYLLHNELAHLNVHIMGPTGSAKTFKVLVPLICQLMAMGDCSVWFADMKGAPSRGGNAAFWIPLFAAAAAGMEVRYYSLNEQEAGHILKTLSNTGFLKLPPRRQSRILAESHNIEHGDDFSRGYYGGVGAKLTFKGLDRFYARGRVPSYRRLAAFLNDKAVRKEIGMTRRDFDNASNAVNSLENLATYPHLNTTGDEPLPASMFGDAISVDLPIRKRTFVYLKLPAGIDAVAGRNVVRFIIQMTMQQLQSWQERRRIPHIYFAIDECQEVLQHRSMRQPIAQGRSAGVHFLLAHQNLSDLRWDGLDMMGPVTNNCAVSIIMGARDDELRERLEKLGGKKIERRRGAATSENDGPNGVMRGRTASWHEAEVPVLDAHALNKVNFNPELAIVTAAPGSGFTLFEGPQLVEIPFPMEPEEFKLMNRYLWPAPIPGETMRAVDFPPDAPRPAPQPEPRPPQPPRGKRTKTVDPAEAARAAEIRERLRRAGGNESA
jgi:hypothetical protein